MNKKGTHDKTEGLEIYGVQTNNFFKQLQSAGMVAVMDINRHPSEACFAEISIENKPVKSPDCNAAIELVSEYSHNRIVVGEHRTFLVYYTQWLIDNLKLVR